MEPLQILSDSHTNYLRLAGIAFLALFVASHTIPLPSFVPAILALCWFLFVPFGMGHFFTNLPANTIKNLSRHLSEIGITSIFIKWAIGFLLIMAISIPLIYAGANSFAIGSAFLLISIFGIFIPCRRSLFRNINPDIVRIVIISLVLGISAAAYIRSFSPYPLTPGMDVFTHLYVVKSIVNNAVYNSPLVYFPSLDMLIALSASAFHADPIEIFWLGTFIISSLFATSLYALSFWIMRSHLNATLSTVIGLLVTEQGLVSNLQFFFPSSLVMSIFPAMFLVSYSILKQTNLNKISKTILVSIPFSVLILIHFQLGLIASILALIYFAISYFATRHRIVLPVIRIITISFAAILLLYYNGYITSQLQLTLIDGQYSYKTPIKIKHLNEWYTSEIVTLSLFGFIVLSLFTKRAVLISFIASVALFVYFQQIDWIHRYITLERPFLAFTAATILTLPVLVLSKPIFLRIIASIRQINLKAIHTSITYANLKKHIELSYPTRVSKTSVIYLALITALLFPTLMIPYDLYIQPYATKQIDFVNFTNEELLVAKWIEHNTPADYTVYSDPFTVLEMRGLSYRSEIEAIGWNATVANMVKLAFTASDSAEAYEKITSHVGDKTLIVIGPRTSDWLKGSDYFVQFPVKKLQTFTGMDNFFDEQYFSLIHQSDNIYVFVPNKN